MKELQYTYVLAYVPENFSILNSVNREHFWGMASLGLTNQNIRLSTADQNIELPDLWKWITSYVTTVLHEKPLLNLIFATYVYFVVVSLSGGKW